MSDPSPITRPGLIERYRRKKAARGPRINDFIPLRERVRATSLAVLFGVATAAEPVLLARGISAATALDPKLAIQLLGAGLGARGAVFVADGASSMLSVRMTARYFYEGTLKYQLKRLRRSQPETGEGNVLHADRRERIYRQTRDALSPTGEIEAGKKLGAEADRLWWQFGTAFALSPLTMLALTPTPTVPLVLAMVLPTAGAVGVARWRIGVHQKVVLKNEKDAHDATIEELEKLLNSKGGLTHEQESEMQEQHEEIAANAGMNWIKRAALGITNTMWLGAGMCASAAGAVAVLVMPAWNDPLLLLQNVGPLAGAFTGLAVFSTPIQRIFGVHDVKTAGDERSAESDLLRELLEEQAAEQEFQREREPDALTTEALLEVSGTFPVNFETGARIRQPVRARDLQVPLRQGIHGVFEHGTDLTLTKSLFNRICFGDEVTLRDHLKLPVDRLLGEGVLRMDSLLSRELQLDDAIKKRPRLALGMFDETHLSKEQLELLEELSKRTTVLLSMRNPADAWYRGWPSVTMGPYSSRGGRPVDSVGITEVLPNTRLAPVIGSTDSGLEGVRMGAVKLMALQHRNQPPAMAATFTALLRQRFGISSDDDLLKLATSLEGPIREALDDGQMDITHRLELETTLPDIVNPIIASSGTIRTNRRLQASDPISRDLATLLPMEEPGTAEPEILERIYDAVAEGVVNSRGSHYSGPYL